MVQKNNFSSKNKEFLKQLKGNYWKSKGFDRLKETGLNEAEIDQLRESFHCEENEIIGDKPAQPFDLISKEEDWLKYEKNKQTNREDMDSPKKGHVSIEIGHIPPLIEPIEENNFAYFYAFLLGLALNIYSELIV